MNKINFTAKDNFPLSSDTMDMIQQMIGLNANMALFGGANYILSGCTDDGNGNISSGVIVINGEILPFEAGIKKTKVTIQQTSKTLTAFGVEYPEAYIYRVAKFSDTGEYLFADFTQIDSILELMGKINSMPSGLISMWSGHPDSIPSGWALCDGRNGTPNLQGKFIAGYSTSSGDYNTVGNTGGEENHQLTVEEMPSHSHGGVPLYVTDTDRGGDSSFFSLDDQFGQTSKTGGGKSHENRPPYYVLAYIIKL